MDKLEGHPGYKMPVPIRSTPRFAYTRSAMREKRSCDATADVVEGVELEETWARSKRVDSHGRLQDTGVGKIRGHRRGRMSGTSRAIAVVTENVQVKN